jgi:hypothetical protein
MIIQKGDIRFIRLKEEDIELVRTWRNSPEITQFMEFRDFISEDMQQEWFESIDTIYNLYFIIEYKGEKVGLINGKNVNWEEMSMEAGVFYWKKDLYDTEVPIIATLIFGDLGVIAGGLTTYAHILRKNSRAIRFNKMIGFDVCEGQENAENQLYKMTRESYLQRSGKLRKAFYQISGKDPVLVHLEAKDYQKGFGQFIEKYFDNQYLIKKEQIGEGTKFYFDIGKEFKS